MQILISVFQLHEKNENKAKDNKHKNIHFT